MGDICPVCQKKLIIGVENRVEQLATHPIEFKPENAKPFFKLLPLHELISLFIGNNMQSKKVWEVYNSLIGNFGNEFNILPLIVLIPPSTPKTGLV